MNKIKIKLIVAGHLVKPLNKGRIENWKSEVFEISKGIDEYKLTSNSDGQNWEFSDALLDKEIISKFDENFLVAIVSVKLENDYYTRRIGKNRVIFTSFEILEILRRENVPFENFILQRIYAYTILYKKYNNIPGHEARDSHDETRGCLFDMNPHKEGIVYSSIKPIICEDCFIKKSQERVPRYFLETIRKELKKINKSSYYRIVDFIKARPISAILISVLFGIIINLISNFIWEFLKNLDVYILCLKSLMKCSE